MRTSDGRHVQQLRGIVDVHARTSDRDGAKIQIRGRDFASHLTDSSVDLDAARSAGENFVDLARALVAPWGIEVWLDGEASRHIATGQITTTSEGALLRQRARRLGVPRGEVSRALIERAFDRRVPIEEIAGASANEAARARARGRAQRESAAGLTASDVQRVALAEARPQAGETVWTFLARHAERFGLGLWFDPIGRLVVSTPDYGGSPLHRIVRRLSHDPSDPNNVIEGSYEESVDRYSEARVYGRTYGTDATRSRFVGRAFDDSVPFYRPLVIHDQGAKSEEEATRIAKRELSKYLRNARVLRYVVRGHTSGGHVYAIDSIVEVVDEALDVEGSFYVYERTFTGSREQGPRTALSLVPIGAITW